MKPIEFKHQTGVAAKDQPPYLPLPMLRFKNDPKGHVISCWKLTFLERIKVLRYGIIWMDLLCFNNKITPSKLTVNRKDVYSHPEDED